MENMEKILEGARIVPRLEKHEAVISRWQYAGEYAFYDPPEPFRLEVAALNARAVKVCRQAGFSIECEVTNSVFRNTFYIMTGARAGA